MRQSLAVVYSVVFLTHMGWGVMSPILPAIQQEFGIPVFLVTVANSAYSLARLGMDMPAGRLAERYDPVSLLTAGVLAAAGGFLICTLSRGFATLLMGRVVSGLGAALVSVTAVVLVTRLSAATHRGRNLGYYQSLLIAGASVAPGASGLLASAFGWRASFAYAAITSVVSVIPMLLVRRNGRRHDRDATSAEPARGGRSSPPAGTSRFHQPSVAAAHAITFSVFFASQGFTNTLAPLLGGLKLGLEANVLGLILFAVAVLRLGTSAVGGILSDLYGRRVILVPGLLVQLVAMSLLGLRETLSAFLLTMLLVGISRFGNNVPVAVLADNCPSPALPRAIGINRLISDLGGIAGPLAIGWCIDRRGFDAAIWLCALVVLGGLCACKVIREGVEVRSLGR